MKECVMIFDSVYSENIDFSKTNSGKPLKREMYISTEDVIDTEIQEMASNTQYIIREYFLNFCYPLPLGLTYSVEIGKDHNWPLGIKLSNIVWGKDVENIIGLFKKRSELESYVRELIERYKNEEKINDKIKIDKNGIKEVSIELLKSTVNENIDIKQILEEYKRKNPIELKEICSNLIISYLKYSPKIGDIVIPLMFYYIFSTDCCETENLATFYNNCIKKISKRVSIKKYKPSVIDGTWIDIRDKIEKTMKNVFIADVVTTAYYQENVSLKLCNIFVRILVALEFLNIETFDDFNFDILRFLDEFGISLNTGDCSNE